MKLKQITNQRGVALLTALMIMVMLLILGFTALNITDIELAIASNEKIKAKAFYASEAGIQRALANLITEYQDDDGWDNTLDPDGDNPLFSDETIGDSTYTVRVIDNDDGDGDTSSDSDDTVIIQATGSMLQSTQNIEAEITTVTESAIVYAVFGNSSITVKNSGSVRSYNSSETASPSSTDSDGDGWYDGETGEADIGSNGEVTLNNKATIGGDIYLGADDADTTASLYDYGADASGTDSYNEDGTLVGIETDAVVSDELFTSGGTVDIAMDSAGEAGELVVANKKTVTLGVEGTTTNYYFSSISLGNSSTLTILGTVNIYMTGDIVTKESSAITTATGLPSDLSIYSSYDGDITLKHGSDFVGTLYAPYADITINNSGDFYGSITGNNVEIKNSGEFWYDTALKESAEPTFSSLKIVSWEQY